VDNLILVSPVGVPNSPYETKNELKQDPSVIDTRDTTVESEFLQSESIESTSTLQEPRPLPQWVTVLWEANFSPFMLVRLPVVGPKFASGWTSKRFCELPPQEQDILSQYAYQIFRLRGSGEYALAYLLAPGAYARRPLMRRVKMLQNDSVLKKVTWVYGSWDWMDVEAGREASERLGDIETDVIVVDKAGHNVHLDNPEGFNKVIYEKLRA
jgi:cardiolipin-specific phospholipase